MPILHWSPRSPYVRKVMIALHEKGLADRVETPRTAADPLMPHEELMLTNPLSKIPTLERAGAPPLWDSRVLMEWADAQGKTGPRLFPQSGEARLITLRDEALGTGLMDVLLPWLVEERMRPEACRYPRQIEVYRRKLASVMDWLDANSGALAARPFDAGHISIGAALCYVRFRFEAETPFAGRERIAAWHAAFCERPSVIATEFRDDPRPVD